MFLHDGHYFNSLTWRRAKLVGTCLLLGRVYSPYTMTIMCVVCSITKFGLVMGKKRNSVEIIFEAARLTSIRRIIDLSQIKVETFINVGRIYRFCY